MFTAIVRFSIKKKLFVGPKIRKQSQWQSQLQ